MEYFHHNKIQELIEHGYNFDIGRNVTEGFEIVKKEIGLFIAYTLIAGLIIITVSSVGSLIQFIDPFSVPLKMFGQIFSQVSTQLISPPLIAGYFIAANKVHNNERLDFADFFKGFEYYTQLVVQGLIVLGLSLLIVVPFMIGFAMMGGFDIYGFSNFGGNQFAILAVLALLMIPVVVYIYVSYIFAPLLIVFGKMKAWDAMEASRQIVGKNFWMVLGFTLVLALVVMLGYVACCVGLLVAFPVTQAALYFCFKDIMDFDGYRLGSGDDGNDILNHLVD